MKRSLCRCLVGLSVVSLLAVDVSHAFENDGEYRSIPTERGFELIDPALVDSEYQSDLLTYSANAEEFESFAANRHFFVSAGSLSATQFDFQLRAQVIEKLNPGLIFKFLRTEQENYEEASRSSIVELQSRIAESSFWFVAYGQLARLKKEDDVGIALLWRGEAENHLRVFVTMADFTRSERNDTGDFFSGRSPMVFGFKWARAGGQLSRELLLRRESNVDWRDPNFNRAFTYENQFVAAHFLIRNSIGEGELGREWTSLRWQWDRKHTGISTISGTGGLTAANLIDRDRQEMEMRHHRQIGEDLAIEFGVLWVARQWKDENRNELLHQNLLPFMSFRHRSGFELGLEATKFDALGDLSLGSASVRTEAIESRVNGRYKIEFENGADLVLALTLDLDRAEGGAFEGGHGKFQTTF